MKVSIVIPCFNLGQYLGDAIGSIKFQTFNDWEVIIVDDGSDDKETKDALAKLKEEHPTFQFIRQKNSGPAAARNAGITRAKGEYIVCLDADDMLTSNYLEETIKIFEEDKPKHLGFVTTWLREFGARENVWQTSDFDVAKMLVTNVAHAGSLFRRQVWQKVSGFNENRDLQGYEDWDFWLRLVEAGYQWRSIPKPLFLYRIRENSLLSVAKERHLEKYQLLYSHHKQLFSKHAGDLVLENTKELKELHDVIKSKNEAITELEKSREELISLRIELVKLRYELNGMKNSRVLGRIIKAREFVGASRQKISPRFVAHKIRVAGAPFVPGPLRRSLKSQLKKVLRPQPKIRLQKNSQWTEGPLVSVVIPHYNRADTIDDTLDSLAAQSFSDFETIIVDDGSTDAQSIEKLRQLKKSGLKAKFIQQENQGVAAARNNGISHARGRYIICLDSDDVLEPSFIEKCTVVLETSPDASLVTTYMETFGLSQEVYSYGLYHPLELVVNNKIITAAQFRKKAWQVSGGYKSGIGYEDWEFWVTLSEHGFWGKLIPEVLFRYRTSMQSRYIEDQELHWKNINTIKNLHPGYRKKVKRLMAESRKVKNVVEPSSAFLNLNDPKSYRQADNKKPHILIAVPWLTFGGAETLILNFCHEIKGSYNLSFVTGEESKHEWEHKFKEITTNIYHLANLFEDTDLYVQFLSNYIKTRQVDVLHIIHTDWVFGILEELKRRHPSLKVVVTMFNDRAAHFGKSLGVARHIDTFTTDNGSVARHYRQELGEAAEIKIIPNGINSTSIFSPLLYDKDRERQALDIGKDQLSVFFIGRLSWEKNPDVFLRAAKKVIEDSQIDNIKFFVIGDGPQADEVKKLISSIGHKNVRYLGYQSDIARYLSAADIFVLPSSIEGFPLSILEAMAMRVAVVASDVGAVAEVIDSGLNGFVVTPGAEDEIADAIIKLSSDPKLLEEMKTKAREKIEKKYSNTILGRNYKKLYENL